MLNRAGEFLGQHKKLVLTLLIGTVIFAFWRQSQGPQDQAGFQTARVERGTLVNSISASGQVNNTGRFPVLSQASGKVTDVYVRNGESIKAGQKILTVELDPVASQKNADVWNSFLQAKTSLDAAKMTTYTLQSDLQTKWKKFYDLATSGTYQNSNSSPREDIRTASAEFNSAQADFKAAEAKYLNQQAVVTQSQAGVSAAWLNYQQTSPDLLAPVSGIIEDLTYVPGMIIGSSVATSGITQSQTIASMVTDSLPTITVNLSEVDVNKVRESNQATATFDALPGKSYSGRIVGINRTGAVSSGVTNYPATIQLDEPEDRILPNMAVSVDILLTRKENVLLVPAEAIRTDNDRATARVLRRGRTEDITVEIGLSSQAQTEVASGLNEGDEVIVGSITPAASQPGASPFSTFRFGGGLPAGRQDSGGGTSVRRGQ